MRPRPPALLLAAAVQAVEAAGLLVAAVLTALDTAAGLSYQRSSGIALTVIAFGAVLALAFIAYGIYRVRRWSRTPALLTQLFVGTTGVYLLEGHRVAWGLPALLAALAGFAGLLVPPSLRALAAGPEPAAAPAAQPRPKVSQPAGQTAQPGSRPAPPAARTARPSGKKPSSRRR